MRLSQMIHINKKGTFLDQWCRYMEAVDAPLGFRFWSGMWLLSVARGGHHPETLSIALVDTKSGPARRVIKEAIRFFSSDPDFELITDDHSVTSMNNTLARRRGLDGISAPAILPDLESFCISDRRARFGTVSLAKAIDKGMPLLGVCTEAWLTLNGDRHLDDRFKDLTLFIPHGNYRRHPPGTVPQAKALWKQYTAICAYAVNFGEICSNEKAKKAYDAWYTSASNRYDTQGEHVKRVAALLSINRGAWEMNKDDIENAIALVANLSKERTAIFGEKIVITDAVADKVERVVYQIAKAGKLGVRDVTVRRALRNTIRSREIGTIISVLHELELIRLTEVKDAAVWYSTIYADKRLFTPEGITEAVRQVKRAMAA